MTPDLARQFDLSVESGVVVLDAVAGGPAGQARLQAGDVIVAVGDQRVDTVEGLLTPLRQRSRGGVVEVGVVRGGARISVSVTVGQRPPG